MVRGIRFTILLVVVVCAFYVAFLFRFHESVAYAYELHELLMRGTVSACFMAIGVAGLAGFGAVYRYETLVEIGKRLSGSAAFATTIWLWPILLSPIIVNRGLTLDGWFSISGGLSVIFIGLANSVFLLTGRR